MKKYLNVAGYDDAARDIAGILSEGDFKVHNEEEFHKANTIYKFQTTVDGEQAEMVMTSVSGHLFELEFIDKSVQNNFRSCERGAFFDEEIEKVCTNLHIKKMLEREIQDCVGLIIWTDFTREWENICFEIIDVCRCAVKNDLQVDRVNFSEMTHSAVLSALDNLVEPNKDISDAVDVRRELDMRTGIAFTRLQSLRLQEAFPTILPSYRAITYGSCQLPTLGFVVERFKAIQDFDAKLYWRITSEVSVNDTVYELATDFSLKGGHLYDKNASVAILDRCKDATATIESIESNLTTKLRPLPLNTAEMAKNISTALNITANDVMEIANNLYRKGFISYPRTETNTFPKDFNLLPLVEEQKNDKRWGVFATDVLNDGGPNPRQGDKTDQAHPPIYPTKYADNLYGKEELVFEYITRHFLASISKDAIGRETIVTADIAREKFVAEGLEILETNYLDVYIYEKWNPKEINQYQKGETFAHTKLDLVEGNTSPPNLLSEADLITFMVQHGIGTDSTYAKHIESIKNRNYVNSLEEKLLLMPTNLGIGLVEGYNHIDVPLAQPILRAEFERQLKLICKGMADPEDVKRDQIEKYKEIFNMVENRMKEFVDSVGNRFGLTSSPTSVDASCV